MSTYAGYNLPSHDEGIYATFYCDYENDDEALMKEQEILHASTSAQADARAQERLSADPSVVSGSEGGDPSEDVIVFRDPDFPAGAASLYRNPFQPPRGALPADMVEWNSVSLLEIEGMDHPGLFKSADPTMTPSLLEDASHHTETLATKEGWPTGVVVQGALKNCWLIGALGALATKPELVKKLFVSTEHAEKGIFTLKIHKMGLPRYIHIDDSIPCNRAGQMHYGHSGDLNEIWAVLVEKAYAKMHGCYENLTGGNIELALKDLTNLPPVNIDLARDDTTFHAAIKDMKAQPLSILVAEYHGEGNPGHGILAGHAYVIEELTSVHADATADFDALDLDMVKLRNIWGLGKWCGPWSQDDQMWADYPEIKHILMPDDAATTKSGEEKKEEEGSAEAEAEAAEEPSTTVGLKEGEEVFWMTWDDFKAHFTNVSGVLDVRADKGANFRFRGKWIPGDPRTGSGGSPEQVSWPQNPQYSFELDSKTTMCVSLSSRDLRWQALPNTPYTDSLGFSVMQLSGTKSRSTKYHPLKRRANPAGFRVAPVVSALMTLQPGRYTIVPSTYEVSTEPSIFILEVYCSGTANFENEGDEVPSPDDLDESDDEELGPIEHMGVEVIPKFTVDPENDGKELEALSHQAGQLAEFMQRMMGEIKGLEERVKVLSEGK